MMRSVFLFLGAFSAFTGVAFGAFGAHTLKGSLTPEMLDIYKTGVSYQMWHALGLCGLALLNRQAPLSRLIRWAGWLMFGGIILFSGSLYLLAIFNAKWLGVITPFGGVAFLTAWSLVIRFAAQQTS